MRESGYRTAAALPCTPEDGAAPVASSAPPARGVNGPLKRAFDIAASLILLIALAPLFALVWLAVRICDGAPVFFAQERIGYGRRPFRFWKFRTMQAGADRNAGEHEAYVRGMIEGRAKPDAKSGLYKLVNDPRVTKLGRVLRRFSLDELPQLWNVLKGEMSLVGPRPPVGYEVEGYGARHLRRFEARPGLSGLWQVSGRNKLGFEEMVELDLRYIEHWSPWLDLGILAKTVFVVLFQRAG